MQVFFFPLSFPFFRYLFFYMSIFSRTVQKKKMCGFHYIYFQRWTSCWGLNKKCFEEIRIWVSTQQIGIHLLRMMVAMPINYKILLESCSLLVEVCCLCILNLLLFHISTPMEFTVAVTLDFGNKFSPTRLIKDEIFRVCFTFLPNIWQYVLLLYEDKCGAIKSIIKVWESTL